MKAPARIAAVTVTTALWVLASAAVAAADAPAGGAWPKGEQRGLLEWVLYFIGGTVLLFVLVALFGLLTARNNYVPPPPGTDLELAPSSEPEVRADEKRTV